MACPFCDPVRNRDRTLKNGKLVYVILSDPRLVFGHLLIIPKRHVEKLSQLTAEERKELIGTAVEFQEKILEKIAEGCDLRQNYRPFQKEDGIKVNHLHLHLLPRELHDNLYQQFQIYETGVFRPLSKEESKELTGKLC